MNGIHAFTGRIGKDAEVRTARDGKPWASVPVAVDAKTDGEAPRRGVRVALFGYAVGRPGSEAGLSPQAVNFKPL